MPGQRQRDRMQTYNDILLAIPACNGRITRILGWTNISYNKMRVYLADLLSRKCIELLEVGEKDERKTRYVLNVTPKGAYLRALITEMYNFFENAGAVDPKDEPPVWILRKMMLKKGLSLEPPRVSELVALPEPAEAPIRVLSRIEVGSHRGWFACPECGRDTPTVWGLRVHVGRFHREKKQELIEKIEYLYELPSAAANNIEIEEERYSTPRQPDEISKA